MDLILIGAWFAVGSAVESIVTDFVGVSVGSGLGEAVGEAVGFILLQVVVIDVTLLGNVACFTFRNLELES